jgi:hypothetical protein
MPNRTAKFVSAIFASLLAGAAFATISLGTANAADNCLSGPKGETPERSHWYYRIDRVTKRHCWYLREGDEKLAPAAAAASPAKPVAAKAEPTMQRSVADARAEFSTQARFEQPKRGDEPAMAAAAAATRDNYGAAPLPDAATSESVVASRWPDSSVAMVPAGPAPVKPDVVAAVSPPPTPTPTVVAAVADASSQAPVYSVPKLLAALMAALAFVGLLAGVIFRFTARRKRPARANLRARRAAGTIWQPTDDDRIVLAADPEIEGRGRWPGFARDLDRGSNADERAAEFFSQLSRRAPT